MTVNAAECGEVVDRVDRRELDVVTRATFERRRRVVRPRRCRPSATSASSAGRGGAHADAQPSGFGADLLEERARGWRRGVRVAGHRAREHVEHRRAVANGARDHVANDEAAPRFAVVGSQRHTPARRLEAEQPAHAGGDADRPAAVACVRERDHSRRHRGTGTAARATRAAFEVPRVARRPVGGRLGRGQQPELGRVRLADRRRIPRP